MRARRRFLAGLLPILAGAAVGMTTAREPLVVITDKPATIDDDAARPPVHPGEPLALRMVDAGAVGVEADTAAWGRDYLHSTHAFHLFADAPPWVDSAAAARVAADWSAYVRHVAAYGNNALTLALFLQLVTFDSLDAGAVYAGAPHRPSQHAALRERLRPMLREAHAEGMQVLLHTDLPAYTTPLHEWQQRQPGGTDPADPRFWRPFVAALEEIFREVPEVDGVVVRVGEAGPLFQDAHWDFWSRFGVTEPAHLRTMLAALLPLFERHDRLLVLRTWSVGVRGLGQLHEDPATYQRVLGDIDSPNLVLSTKFVDFDFFGMEPLNPTLATGRHRRLVEFQARREFEGSSALPNYLGATHAHALASLRAANPNVIGTWLWTQSGGPPRAGPMLLYPRLGPWRWNDVSVFATSRLAVDPGAEPEALAREWARTALGADDSLARVFAQVAMRTRPALLDGLYVRPFAERRALFAGRRLPSLLWVYEWDIVGGASASGSVLYAATRDRHAEAIAGGARAVAEVRDMRDALQSVAPRFRDPATYRELDAALAYEESLFEALARYREWLLSLYRWLDTGDREAAVAVRDTSPLLAAIGAHESRYAGSLDFPAFDLSFARAEVARVARAPGVVWFARAMLAVALLSTLLARRRPGAGSIVSAAMPAAGLGALTSFDAPRLVAGTALVGVTAVLALRLAWRHAADAEGAVRRALLPATALGAILLAACAWRGPMQAWFLFWTDDAARALLLALLAGAFAWLGSAVYSEARELGLVRPRALASALLAGGTTLLVAALLAPPLPVALAALFEPLGILPVRLSLQLAVQEYVGIPAGSLGWFRVLGAALVLGGWVLWGRARAVRPRATVLTAPLRVDPAD